MLRFSKLVMASSRKTFPQLYDAFEGTRFHVVYLLRLIIKRIKLMDKIGAEDWHVAAFEGPQFKRFHTAKGIPLSDLQHCPKTQPY